MAISNQNITANGTAHPAPAVVAASVSTDLIDPDLCCCETKAKIVQVAKQRFLHYGYNKTTISDIASDCKMSAGNIYRYFDNKLDIATMIVKEVNQDLMVKTLRKIDHIGKAQDKFRAFLLENLRATHSLIEENPKLADIVRAVRKERPEIRRNLRKMERALLEDIIRYGRKTGEFRVDCIASTARIIQCFIGRFRWPHLTSPHSNLKRLETELEGVMSVISTALSVGCILGKIMSKHPKIQEHQTISPKTHNIPLPKGAVF